MAFFDPNSFDNPPPNHVNLSTRTSTSSSALLSSVRAERQAREQRKREEGEARKIQRVWRGGRARENLRQELVRRLTEGEEGGEGLERRARWLVVLLSLGRRRSGGSEEDGIIRGLVERWCGDATRKEDGWSSFLITMLEY